MPTGAARHHQGQLADPQLHLGGVVPGNHPRPYRCAVDGKVDTLDGLKENVIVGRLIPAGTGVMPQRVAAKRDALILEEREKEAAERAAAAEKAEQVALPAAE